MWHFPVAIPPSLGVWAVFMSVLITQLGMPIPAAPMLILGGTMAAMGQTSYASVIGAAVVATLIADSLWFFTGRAYGRRLLNQLVRFSLSLDTTVRVARNTYERYGAPILTVAKFLPGLGLISAPLLGTHANQRRRVSAVGFCRRGAVGQRMGGRRRSASRSDRAARSARAPSTAARFSTRSRRSSLPCSSIAVYAAGSFAAGSRICAFRRISSTN